MLNRPVHPLKGYNLTEFLNYTQSDQNRYELIDGEIHMMASPSVTHYRMSQFISDEFRSYFKDKKCEVFMGSVDVFLFENSIDNCFNCYVPDIFVVCNKSKITERGIYGAPDFVVEIISESSRMRDLIIKLNGYMRYGVREYWTVDYKNDKIIIHSNMNDALQYKCDVYDFGDIVKSGIFDLHFDFSKFVSEYEANDNDTV